MKISWRNWSYHVPGEHKTCHWSPAQELGSTSYSNSAKAGQGITEFEENNSNPN